MLPENAGRYFHCAGVALTATSHESWLSEVKTLACATGPHVVHLCNAYTMVCADRFPEMRNALTQPGALNIPDGVSMSLLARLQGVRCPDGAFRGPDLMARLLTQYSDNLRHFFFGSSAETLSKLEQKSEAGTAYVHVGSFSPPFGQYSEDDLADFAQLILDAGANVVWVGLGTPKQDIVAQALAELVPSAVFVCVGAAFDFLSGSKPVAPRWIQGTGMEWLFRLLVEPRRLWRRYTVDSVHFARIVFSSWRKRHSKSCSTYVHTRLSCVQRRRRGPGWGEPGRGEIHYHPAMSMITQGRGARSQAMLVRAVARATRPFDHRGVQRAAWTLGARFDKGNSVIVRQRSSGSLLKVNLNDGYWAAVLDPKFEYEAEVASTLAQLLDPIGVFLDCGANIGYWSIMFQRDVSSTVAIEASPETYAKLLDNLSLNGNSVRPVHGALWNREGETLEIVSHEHRHAGASVVNRASKSGTPGYLAAQVPTTTIDAQVSATARSDQPVVIKLDVEGAEFKALEGATETLARSDMVLVYEDHGQDPQSDLTGYLATLGLDTYAVEGGVRKVDQAQVSALKTDASRGYNFVACRPNSLGARRVAALRT